MFRANGFAATIEPLEGWSTAITLPEPACVLVSEMIGSEPLEEHILEITMDARRRLLKPGARLCPSVLDIWALPVLVPATELDHRFFTQDAMRRWNSWYGLDFTVLHELSRNQSAKFLVSPDEAKDWPTACDAVMVSRIDLAEFEDTSIENSAPVVCQRSGAVNAVMTFFRAELAPDNWISTHPLEAGPSNHLANPIRLFPAPLQLTAGQPLEIRYHYRGAAHEPHEIELIPGETPH
jgi:hypothetical protein